jgi:hypothetical protein
VVRGLAVGVEDGICELIEDEGKEELEDPGGVVEGSVVLFRLIIPRLPD